MRGASLGIVGGVALCLLLAAASTSFARSSDVTFTATLTKNATGKPCGAAVPPCVYSLVVTNTTTGATTNLDTVLYTPPKDFVLESDEFVKADTTNNTVSTFGLVSPGNSYTLLIAVKSGTPGPAGGNAGTVKVHVQEVGYMTAPVKFELGAGATATAAAPSTPATAVTSTTETETETPVAPKTESADLALTISGPTILKVPTGRAYNAAERATFTIKVTNNGPDAAELVNVTPEFEVGVHKALLDGKEGQLVHPKKETWFHVVSNTATRYCHPELSGVDGAGCVASRIPAGGTARYTVVIAFAYPDAANGIPDDSAGRTLLKQGSIEFRASAKANTPDDPDLKDNKDFSILDILLT